MSLSLAVVALVSVQSAAPNVWVVLSRRSGVAAPKAMEVTKAVSSQLGNSGLSTLSAEDLSKCNGKKPCLLEQGRKNKVAAMVFVEVGTVLDDAFARAEAISVEEDGKRVALAEVEGPIDGLNEAMRAKVKTSLVVPRRQLLGVETPLPADLDTPPVATGPKMKPEPEPTPEPVAETPPPAPPATQVVATEPEPAKPFFTGGRIAGVVIAGVGAGVLIASAVAGGVAASNVSQQTSLCPNGMQCSNPAAFTAYNNAASAQNTSVALLGVGLGLAATGVVVMLLAGGSSAPAQEAAPAQESASFSIAPMPGGVAATLSGSF